MENKKEIVNLKIKNYLNKIRTPLNDSHKGQNGKLLLIGGSQLFHAASKWSLDVASKFVDMVFYSSVADNNELIKKIKGDFWNGIVVPRGEVEKYIIEADCVLIGPGMTRDKKTKEFVDGLVKKYADKKWVIDAGALQVINPQLLNKNHIITPHIGEMSRLERSFKNINLDINKLEATVLLKGKIDKIFFLSSDSDSGNDSGNDNDGSDNASDNNNSNNNNDNDNGNDSNNDDSNGNGNKINNEIKQVIEIAGGNVGMTKGGSGDSLAGLVAALYCTNDKITSAVIGSYINKKAGDELYKTVGPYFNTSDLVATIPKVFWKELQKVYAKKY